MFDADSFVLQAIPLLLIYAVFYCIVIRPGRVAEQKRWAAVKGLTGGERLELASGMLATFICLHGPADGGEYEIEVSPGVHARVFETAIKRVGALADSATAPTPASGDPVAPPTEDSFVAE